MNQLSGTVGSFTVGKVETAPLILFTDDNDNDTEESDTDKEEDEELHEPLPFSTINNMATPTDFFAYGDTRYQRLSWSLPDGRGEVGIYPKGITFWIRTPGQCLDTTYLSSFDLNIWKKSDTRVLAYLAEHWAK